MRTLVLVAALLLSSVAGAQEIIAYHASWMGDAWRQYDLGRFRRILFFDVVAGNDGRLAQTNGWPERWEGLRQQAAAQGVAVDPVVTVLGLEPFKAIFGDPAARARLLEACVGLARDGGLHLDVEVFEAPAAAEVEGFRQFVAALRQAMDKPPRRSLTAFVHAGGQLYSARELAYLDEVVVQGYDVYWAEAPTAGPVALLDGDSIAAWRPAAEAMTKAGVMRKKLFFSTPLYGYEWPVASDQPRAPSRGKARITTYAPVSADQLPDLRVNALSRVAALGLRREAGSDVPWYAWQEQDGWWQGWFDDALSLRKRLDFVRAGGYGGVAFFVLGYDGGALVEAARNAFRAPARPAGNAGPEPGR